MTELDIIEVRFALQELQPLLKPGNYEGYCRHIGERLRAAGIPVKDDIWFYDVSHGELRRMDDPLTSNEVVYRWEP